MAGRSNPNRLIVEGYDDLQSVAALMGHYIPWNQDKHKAPVWIEIGNGADEILKDGYLSAELKSAPIKTLGVMLDGDAKPDRRYQRLCDLCVQFFPELPMQLPEQGLIIENHYDKKRFGVWIMPDNATEGDLEVFLKYLVPHASESTWNHAIECVTTARGLGCPCRDAHLTKANLYTWLAWQDPPGQSPGRALTQKILDPNCQSAGAFVKWFRELYRL